MYQGFYNLTSGMLTQNRNLNVIGNNMVNIQTPGYKRDKMVSTTFEEEMLYRTGRTNKDIREDLGVTSKIKTAQQTYVNYGQGSFDSTGGIYDFALSGNGFFCINTEDGVRYTRNGSFHVDEEGYLMLDNLGRVQGEGGQPIQIDNENLAVGADGTITAVDEAGNAREYGKLRVVDFEDYDQMHKEDNGLYSTGQGPRQVEEGETKVLWKMVERSNVDMVEEMTAMMSAQRALQSAAQVLKMYDQIMSKSATDVGRL
ncbi:MAG: flagellar hook-basal body protein [Lachnospiraceae bacterium]|nr:flagellar hook-basal body protein [Lachnospiraceae bacterium]